MPESSGKITDYSSYHRFWRELSSHEQTHGQTFFKQNEYGSYEEQLDVSIFNISLALSVISWQIVVQTPSYKRELKEFIKKRNRKGRTDVQVCFR